MAQYARKIRGWDFESRSKTPAGNITATRRQMPAPTALHGRWPSTGSAIDSRFFKRRRQIQEHPNPTRSIRTSTAVPSTRGKATIRSHDAQPRSLEESSR